MKKIYTKEKNIQILLSLLKEHNIRKVIINPGTTNISFVASIQSDDWFEVYSCVDERSAAYMACGLSEESGEPVVLTCTGATASRNYMPGLTEAFYSKLPIVVVTATQHLGRVGQNIAQVIDRSAPLADIVKKSIQLPSVYSDDDIWACNLKINEVLLECKRNGGGPVHINMVTTYSNEFETGEFPHSKKIERIRESDDFPKIDSNKKNAIFIGNHTTFSPVLTKEIECFCEKYNAIVLCDHTSNYYGKYKIMGNLVCGQDYLESDLKHIDLLISIGNISGSYMEISVEKDWRVNPDGEIRDTYKKLEYVFDMEELEFFKEYNRLSNDIKTDYYNSFIDEDKKLRKKLSKEEIPFSNIWISQNTIDRIPDNSIVHLAILNTLRSWNFFENHKNSIKFYSNTGGFGIDGIVSTAVGTSLCTDKIVYCFVGDLAFFYDMNSIGNKNVKNNLRIMLINNGCGTEFHNYNHRAMKVSNNNDLSPEFFAADGHFGNKSRTLVKHYAEDLGFKYLSAANKDEFLNNIDLFIDTKSDNPIVFEIFTNPEEESDALKKVRYLETSAKGALKKVLGEKGKKIVKKMIGR